MWIIAIAAALFLVPYILAVAMPSRRGLLACGVLVGGLLAYLIVGMVTTKYDYGEAEDTGIALLLSVAVPFGSGVLVRAATLIMAARGWSRRRVLEVHFLGLALPAGIVAMAMALRA
jgi:hypothetical protein